ncbi:27 kDa glycoprotein [Drosophila innubila]|uniref:27 kDa glycoprotein n=1 Tax=Drosophila innubila TaxID=198719 RepID=UPI00148D6DCC|nr:27 kDa glycoprotein [Drosophila innubila]
MDTTLNGSHRLIAFLIALLGYCCCLSAGQLTLPNDVANFKDLNVLGAHYLPAGYAQSNITYADLQRLLKQKCQKANSALPEGEVDAAKLSGNIEQASINLVKCVGDLVNISAVMDEVELAKPKGDLDVVFEKYCLRLPNMTNCLTEFNSALLPCMTREERNHNSMMMRILGKLLDFVCYKNGDQIALFIAEQGPECLDQHKGNVSTCLQNTFGHYLPSQLNVSQLVLPDLLLGPRQCVELHDFETCVLRHLETCDNITPSNIVESMFRYVRRQSDCQQTINREIRDHSEALGLRAGAASCSWSSATTAALLLPLALLLRSN